MYNHTGIHERVHSSMQALDFEVNIIRETPAQNSKRFQRTHIPDLVCRALVRVCYGAESHCAVKSGRIYLIGWSQEKHEWKP